MILVIGRVNIRSTLSLLVLKEIQSGAAVLDTYHYAYIYANVFQNALKASYVYIPCIRVQVKKGGGSALSD